MQFSADQPEEFPNRYEELELLRKKDSKESWEEATSSEDWYVRVKAYEFLFKLNEDPSFQEPFVDLRNCALSDFHHQARLLALRETCRRDQKAGLKPAAEVLKTYLPDKHPMVREFCYSQLNDVALWLTALNDMSHVVRLCAYNALDQEIHWLDALKDSDSTIRLTARRKLFTKEAYIEFFENEKINPHELEIMSALEMINDRVYFKKALAHKNNLVRKFAYSELAKLNSASSKNNG